MTISPPTPARNPSMQSLVECIDVNELFNNFEAYIDEEMIDFVFEPHKNIS